MRKMLFFKTATLCMFSLLILSNINAQVPEQSVKWKFAAGAFQNMPVVSGDTAYIGSMDKYFYAIDANTGAEIWKFQAAYPITSNAAIFDTIVCFESGNKLYGLNAQSGTLLWSFVASQQIPGLLEPTNYHHSSPVIYNKVAYYGDAWGNMNGIDIVTGELKFQYFTNQSYTKLSDFTITSTPAIKNDIIYFGDFGAKVYAVSLKDSSLNWIQSMNALPLESTGEILERSKWDGSVVSEIVIKDTVLYFGGYNNHFNPLNIKNGKAIWRFTDANTFLPSVPVFYKNDIIIGSTLGSSKIHCLDIQTGLEKWFVQAKGIFFLKPTIIKDSILVINSTDPFASDKTGALYFINLNNGTVLNHYHLDQPCESSPVWIDDKILLGRNDGIYALDYEIYTHVAEASDLIFNDTKETITINKDEALNLALEVINNSVYCDTLNLFVAVEGDELKSKISITSLVDKEIKPNQKLIIEIKAKASALDSGTYNINMQLQSKLKSGSNNLGKEINLIVKQRYTDVGNIKISDSYGNAYPNPFVNQVNFLPANEEAGPTLLSIYGLDQKLVYLKVFNEKEALVWNVDNGANLREGSYFYTLRKNKYTKNGVLIKKQ